MSTPKQNRCDQAEQAFFIRDHRKTGWFWADNELIDLYGKKVGLEGIALLYVYLCRHVWNSTQRCTKKQTEIAEAFAVNRKRIQRHLAKLVDAGLVAVEQEGRADATSYILLDVPKQDITLRSQNRTSQDAPKQGIGCPKMSHPIRKQDSLQDSSQDGETAPEQDADAEALQSVTLARKVIEQCYLPHHPSMVRAVAGAIDFCVKREGRTKRSGGALFDRAV